MNLFKWFYSNGAPELNSAPAVLIVNKYIFFLFRGTCFKNKVVLYFQ